MPPDSSIIMKRILFSILTALLATITVPAQDWAKARLEKSPRHLEWVKIKHGDREVNCFIAYPEVKEKATAVIVIHEIFGLSDWARNVTDELAERRLHRHRAGFAVRRGAGRRRHRRTGRS